MLADLAASALRRLDPERAHGLAIGALKAGLGPRAHHATSSLAVRIAGLDLPNCVGLAAGFDKHAEVAGPMLTAGFGFVECGTVTPRPQPGNPRPRLFRLTEDGAVINRFGFNSVGVEAFAQNLERRPAGIVGANLGANKETEDKAADYVAGLRRLWPLADYFTVNISSPNTPGLRALQGRAMLDDLLGRIGEAREDLAVADNRPVFLKVAPDLDEVEIDDICASAIANSIDALIVSNTTLARPETLSSPNRGEAGGLSGAPLLAPSTQVLKLFAERLKGTLPLIGCGGIGSGADAYGKILAGASAVQLYSALVYGGLGLIGSIKRDLATRLKDDGFASVSAAVGAGG